MHQIQAIEEDGLQTLSKHTSKTPAISMSFGDHAYQASEETRNAQEAKTRRPKHGKPHQVGIFI